MGFVCVWNTRLKSVSHTKCSLWEQEEVCAQSKLYPQPRPALMRQCGWWEFKSCQNFFFISMFTTMGSSVNTWVCHNIIPTSQRAWAHWGLSNEELTWLQDELSPVYCLTFPRLLVTLWLGTMTGHDNFETLIRVLFNLASQVFKIKRCNTSDPAVRYAPCPVVHLSLIFSIWSSWLILEPVPAPNSIQWWQTQLGLWAVE